MQTRDTKPGAYDASPVTTSSAEAGTRTKPSFGTRAKANLKRWWWLYFLIFAALVLIIVLPIIYVGFPNIAQDGINESRLEMESQEIADPTPTSFRLRQMTVTHSDSKRHPKLGAFRAALFLENTLSDINPFGYLNIPSVKTSKETRIEVDEVIQIENLEQYTEYTKTVHSSEEFRVGVRGRTSLEVSGLPSTTVDFNKVITMKGLNSLKGLNITDFEVKLKPEPDGSNMVGTVFIPNPSVLTIHMGNVTLDLSVDGQPIGVSTLPDLVLRPGPNEVAMRAKNNQSVVLNLLSTKYQNGVLPLDIIGNSSIYNGEHLTYYEAAIRAHPIRLDLNVGEALGSLGLNLGG